MLREKKILENTVDNGCKAGMIGHIKGKQRVIDMIEKTIDSEFGSYVRKYNHGYPVHTGYFCIDAYEDVPEYEHWEKCHCCGLKPKIWKFNNGLSTACGCWENRYDIFSVRAESIMSVHIRCNGSLAEYSSDQLRLNWNEYCATTINPCNHADLRFEGKW